MGASQTQNGPCKHNPLLMPVGTQEEKERVLGEIQADVVDRVCAGLRWGEG
jgi:hypothetical protein